MSDTIQELNTCECGSIDIYITQYEVLGGGVEYYCRCDGCGKMSTIQKSVILAIGIWNEVNSGKKE